MRRYPDTLTSSNLGRSPTPHIISASPVGSVLSRINNLPHTNVWPELERQQRLRLENPNVIISDITPSSFTNITSNLESMVISELSINGGRVISMVILGCAVTSYITHDSLGIHDLISSRVINSGFLTEHVFFRESLVHATASTTGLEIVPYDGSGQASISASTGVENVPYDGSAQASTSAQPSTSNTGSSSIRGGAILLGLMLAWVSLGNEGIIDVGMTSTIAEMFDH